MVPVILVIAENKLFFVENLIYVALILFLPFPSFIDFIFLSGKLLADIVLIGHVRCMYNRMCQSLIAIMNCDFVACSVDH
jgi:hypothetical protein